MFPGSAEALIGLILAVVPGFVAVATWSRARTWKAPESELRLVLQSLVLSIAVQGALLPVTFVWIYPVREEIERYPERLTIWVLLATVVVPLLGGLVAGRTTDYLADPISPPRGRLARLLAAVWPTRAPPSVWDWLFKSPRPYGKFLVLTLKDGRRVAGVFSEGSVAMTSPEPQGLFLAKEWELGDDGEVTAPVRSSAGIMIRDVEDILTVRVLEVQDDGRQAAVEGDGPGQGQGSD